MLGFTYDTTSGIRDNDDERWRFVTFEGGHKTLINNRLTRLLIRWSRVRVSPDPPILKPNPNRLGFFLPAAPALAGLPAGSGVSPSHPWCIFLPTGTQNPLFSPFDLWLDEAHTLDFMRVSGRWLGVNRPDQKPCKPVLRIEAVEQLMLLIPVRWRQMVLQPEQAQGLRLAPIEDAAHQRR